MKTQANFILPFFLVIAFAGVGALVGDTCNGGFCSLSGVYAAQISRGPVAPKRDPQMEKEGAHHLDVAWQYFKRKVDKNDKEALTRTNKAIADRLNEIIDTNAEFSKMDEVYFLLGEVYLRDNDQEKAVKCLTNVADNFPDSKFNAEAKKRLASLTANSGKKSEDKEEKQEGKKKS